MRQEKLDIDARYTLIWIVELLIRYLIVVPQASIRTSLSIRMIDSLMTHTGRILYLLAHSVARLPLAVTNPITMYIAMATPTIVKNSQIGKLRVGIECKTLKETINLWPPTMFVLIALGCSKQTLRHSLAPTPIAQARVRPSPFEFVAQARSLFRTIPTTSPCVKRCRPSTGRRVAIAETCAVEMNPDLVAIATISVLRPRGEGPHFWTACL